MRSPFPGMDPFLVGMDWRDFQTDFIVSIRDLLARQVSPNFVVRIEERVDIVEFGGFDERYIMPDAYVISQPKREPRESRMGLITPATFIEPFLSEEVVERYIELRAAKTNEIVAVIEVLSPTNKIPNSDGGKAFRAKRETVIQSNTHWIEIDLLRAGERLPFVQGKSDYLALLKRAHVDRAYEVWFFNLRDQMPTIAVPLRPPFDDVPLNLQAAFDATYERAYYADSLDYTQEPPEPALNEQDATWVQDRVREWMNACAAQKSS